LGVAEVSVNGSLVQWRAESARELFFYLLSNPEGHSREHIVEVLWNSSADARASNRFRVTIHRIRVALGWPGAVLEEHSLYRLDPEVLQASDMATFYQALEKAKHAPTAQAQLGCYQQALSLYQGEYLPSEEADWAIETREQLRTAYVQTELEVARLLCEKGNCPDSVAALSRALHADPYLGENHHQQLMRCLARVSGKYAAIEHYRRFAHFLHAELNDTPMPETIQLAEDIKRGNTYCAACLWSCPLSQSPGEAPSSPVIVQKLN